MAANMNQPVDTGSSMTQSLIDAFKTGQATIGGTPTQTESAPAETEVEASESRSIVDEWNSLDQETEAADTSAESQDNEELSEGTEAVDSSKSNDIEELVVTGANGRKKVKVDFSDKDKLKKHIQLSYGARKWQKERDDARSELSSVQKEYKSLQEDWEKLETTYQEKGIKGLVTLLAGNENAYSEFLNKELENHRRFQSMSPEEKLAYERERRIEQESLSSQKLKQEYEKKLEEIRAEQDKAELRALEARIHPSFDRYRFRGKLGDEVAETEFDEMLWNRAISSLEKISESDVELNQAIIDKEFRRIAQTIQKHLSTQVDNRLKKTITKKKQDAAKKVSAQVSKGMSKNQNMDEFRSNMKSGNIVDGLASFFRAGGKLK